MGRRTPYAVTFATVVACAALVLALIGWINSHTRLDAVARSAIRSDTPVVVHVDPVGGSDARTGAAPVSAVQTLARAISVLAESAGPLGVIRVSAGTLDLGADPILSFGSVARQYDALRVEGERQSVLQDTVASIVIQNPLSSGFYQIGVAAGGYAPDAYARHFISNDDMKRVYVVESNTASTVNTVARALSIAPSQSVYLPVPVAAAPWAVGERFTLFRVGATTITWTGQLSLDIPYNTVTFDSIWMNPSVAGSRVRAPDGPQHRVVFEACTMTLQSSSITLPSLMGSMLMRGVFAEGAVPAAAITGLQRDRCLMTESLWVDNDVTLFYSGSCAATAVKNTNSHAPVPIRVSSAAQFFGQGIEITGHNTSLGFVVDISSIAVISGVRILRNVGAISGAQFVVDVETQATLSNLDIECAPLTLCTSALEMQEGTKVRLGGHMRLMAGRLMNVAFHSSVDLYAISSWTVPPAGSFTTAPIEVGQGAHLSMVPGIAIPISTVGTALPIISVARGRVDFLGVASQYQWSTNTGIPLVRVLLGSTVTTAAGIGVNGMNVSNFNYGPTSTDIIKCGANAISAWTVTETDFAAVGTQACMCVR